MMKSIGGLNIDLSGFSGLYLPYQLLSRYFGGKVTWQYIGYAFPRLRTLTYASIV